MDDIKQKNPLAAKPCPFCGARDTETTSDISEGAMRLRCRTCKALGPAADLRDPDPQFRAIDGWNNRAP